MRKIRLETMLVREGFLMDLNNVLMLDNACLTKPGTTRVRELGKGEGAAALDLLPFSLPFRRQHGADTLCGRQWDRVPRERLQERKVAMLVPSLDDLGVYDNYTQVEASNRCKEHLHVFLLRC
jgi:hypothetical protein